MRKIYKYLYIRVKLVRVLMGVYLDIDSNLRSGSKCVQIKSTYFDCEEDLNEYEQQYEKFSNKFLKLLKEKYE